MSSMRCEQGNTSKQAYKRFPIFLSSLCTELIDLRARAYEDIGGKINIYVDEKANPRDIKDQDHLATADDLIQRVREADLFVCILGGTRHGTPIRVSGRPSAVSFFEIELYQAALRGNGVKVYVRNDFEPDARLSSVLDVLSFALGDWRWLPRLTDSEILSHLRRDIWLGRAAKIGDAIHYHSLLARLVQGMYALRARNRPPPVVNFLNNEKETAQRKPDLTIVSSIQKDLQKRSNEEQRLSRIWIAIRELMAAHYSQTSNPEVLEFWNEILGSWASAGSWYGLHGDMPLGCLAALNSQLFVREKLKRNSRTKDEAYRYGYAGGALASAKYSIAKRLYVGMDRKARFEEALEDIKQAIDQKSADLSGLLAIKGSIHRSTGRISEAIADYEEVLRLRNDGRHSGADVGQAENELGYSYLRQWRWREALELCEEGVKKMRDEPLRKGFLVRGLRKLAAAYALNGQPVKAFETYREARDISRAAGTFDQLK